MTSLVVDVSQVSASPSARDTQGASESLMNVRVRAPESPYVPPPPNSSSAGTSPPPKKPPEKQMMGVSRNKEAQAPRIVHTYLGFILASIESMNGEQRLWFKAVVF